MTRTWLSIRVDLVEGRGERLRPRPGRIIAAARSHSFAALATAIDDAFVAGTATTARLGCPAIPAARTCRRCGPCPQPLDRLDPRGPFVAGRRV